MTLAIDPTREALLQRLRAQAEAPARSRAERCLPVPDAFAKLLPDAGLKQGATYCLGVAGSLLTALLSEPSQAGSWCGVVGMPEFGVEAAQAAGIALDRLVLVPDPGDQWLAVTAALAEVLPVIAVRPGGRVREGDAARLTARLRDRGGVLLVHGDWPRVEARLQLAEPRWAGLGIGHGCLTSREVVATATSKRFAGVRSVRLRLPDPQGRLALAAPVAPVPVRLKAAG